MPTLLVVLTTALTLACGVFSSPTTHLAKRYTLKSTHHVPRKWDRVGSAPLHHTITLQIGLRQGKSDEILRNLKEGIVVILNSIPHY
jgi:tripeptidyl-peptidase-1